jgi:hypothetical protein
MTEINTRLGITGSIGIGVENTGRAKKDYLICFNDTTYGYKWTMQMSREEMATVCGLMIKQTGIKPSELDYFALKAENRRLTGELEQVYERLNDLTEKIKNLAEKHNIKATNVENLQEKDIN